VPIPKQRDPELTTKAIAGWLERTIDGAHDVSVSNISAPPGSGFSNETILADASWTGPSGRRESEELVVRVEPTTYRVFYESNFEQQQRILEVLARETDVPVPAVLWTEDDDTVLGAPFFVMRKLPGVAAPDQPLYNEAGWLADAPPELRRTVWRNGVDALIKVHAVPTEVVDFLVRPELGPTGLDQTFASWCRAFEWAARGEEYPIAAAAREWLERNLPAVRPTALSWGDARIGNILFHEGRVQAVVDWEMLSLGGHEMDLGWWLFLDDFHSFGVPRLEGLGTRAETIELWEERTGERASDLEWYEVFAGFRFAVVMMRIGQMYESFGVSREDRGDVERNNPVVHLLARKLDIAPPPPLPRR
jgi:aminoglycoside phosphotransferase (APT) family kinase protein